MKKRAKLLVRNRQTGIAIYIDVENETDIMSYVRSDSRHLKKFRFITGLILQGLRNCEVYDKEDVSIIAKDVTAMKFFKGQENDRVYCKEIKETGKEFKIVMVSLYERKKSKKLSKKEKQMIERIGGYTYEME